MKWLLIICLSGSFFLESIECEQLKNAQTKVIQKICKDYHLEAYSSGCYFPDKCDALFFQLIDNNAGDIVKGRALIVDLAKSVINLVNTAEISPEILTADFTIKNVFLLLCFEPPLTSKNEIDFIFLKQNEIIYATIDSGTEKSKITHLETYEEALKALKSQ